MKFELSLNIINIVMLYLLCVGVGVRVVFASLYFKAAVANLCSVRSQRLVPVALKHMLPPFQSLP